MEWWVEVAGVAWRPEECAAEPTAPAFFNPLRAAAAAV